ncbi:pertactin-like passenger domain-containing protein [Methyloglobulus sp.]|uniref:pertactin-like passenger domain-containing protein n=1 Tax=Methyloglobulus sp. TaxID=2518622 RepID=UPI003989BAD6
MTGGTIVGAVTQGAGIDTFTMTGGQIQSLAQGDARDTFFMSSGTIVGNISVSGGDDQVTVTGGRVIGDIRTSFGNDTFVWDGGGVINGNILMGNGTGIDTAALRNLTSANMGPTLVIDGGFGVSHLSFDNVVTDGVSRFQDWETFAVANGSQLTFDGNLVLGDASTGTGSFSVDSSSTLFGGNGVNPQISPAVAGQLVTFSNAGAIDLSNGPVSAADSFTIVGNYIGMGGHLNLQTILGTDNSPSDKLAVSGGSASGTTNVGVTNVGGSGGLTLNNGILVVQAVDGGTTAPGAFSLAGGSVSAGAYQYYLFRGGATGGTANNWYLRSNLAPTPPGVPSPQPAPGTPPLPTASETPIPLYRPETALYSAVPALARQVGYASLGTFHERQGEQSLLKGNGPASAAWGRALGKHTDQQ